MSDRGIGLNFPVFGLMIEPLFHISCRWKSVHFSVSSVPDILLLAYQHSMPDALNLVLKMCIRDSSYMVGMMYHRKNGAIEVGEAEKVYDMIW